VVAKASLVLTATLAVSGIPEQFSPNAASAGAVSRIENIRAALRDGSHKLLMRGNSDGGYVVITQFNQSFSNAFQNSHCTTGSTC
jgi:hypothetical protein